MQTIKFNNISFYEAENIKENYPTFFKGCRTLREIINRKNIPKKSLCWVKYIKDRYEESHESYKKAKLLISRKWLKNEINIDEYKKNEYLPPKILICDKDMFEINGKKVDIDLRGKRVYDKIFFQLMMLREFLKTICLRKLS